MRENFKKYSSFLLLFIMAIFSNTMKAQTNENGGGFNWDGINDLDNVNVSGNGGGSNNSWDYASHYWNYEPNNYIGSNNDYYNQQYSTGGSGSGQTSGGGNSGGSGAVDRQTRSQVVLTKKVLPGQTHTQDVKVLRDPNTSTNKKVIDLIVNGEKVGTVTFNTPVRDANGVDIYSKMTVEVFHNCPVAITNIVFDAPETSSYIGDQHSTNGNLEKVLADINVYEDFKQMSFTMPINEEEDLIIITSGVPINTPQSYEEALNEAGKGDFKITNGVVKIKADNGTYVLTSDANVASNTVLQRVKNLAAIITKSLGGDNKEIYIDTQKGKESSSRALAYTLKISPTSSIIYINSNGGFSPLFNNINNFKSVLIHEMFHAEDNKDSKFVKDLPSHADVYVKAANHYTFNNTTDDFKKGAAGSFANYLLNMAVDPNIPLSEIEAKINAFNKNNAGVQIIKPAGVITKATLTLRVQYKNVISEPIEYEKLTV
ncbi:hypothetical protein [Flavobacterium sp.]|uniref:hypothetical protein n=1 Tax=Flavobacterium sp. TaxID=239 RepID=UPI0031DA4FED